MITSPASYSRVTGDTAEHLLCSTRCSLLGIYPDNTTTGSVTVRDGRAADASGTTVSVSATGLTQLGKTFGTYGIQLSGLTVQLGAGADAVIVAWMPLP